jgi:hypothetical protein
VYKCLPSHVFAYAQRGLPVWRLLDEDLTRNAAGRAFQAWRALLAALPRLELDRLKPSAKTNEERR